MATKEQDVPVESGEQETPEVPEEVYADHFADDESFVSDGEIVDMSEDEDEEEAVEPEADAEEAEPEGEEEATEAEEPVEEPEEGDTAEAAPAEEPEAPEVEAEVVESFAFKVDGREVVVEGSRVDGDNISIPREAWNKAVQPRLADRNAWIEERRQMQNQLQALSPDQNPEVVKARTLIQHFSDLLEKGPEAVNEWLLDYEVNRPTLEAQMEVAARDAEIARLKGETEPVRQAAEIETMETQMRSGLETILDRAADVEELSGFDRDTVLERLWNMRNALYFRAPEDMPEYGLKAGEIGVRLDLIEPELEYDARMRKAVTEAKTAAEERATVRAENAAATGPVVSPPVAGTTVTGDSGNPRKPPKNKQEWETHMAAVASGRA